jgi:DNA-binding protein HU-beta
MALPMMTVAQVAASISENTGISKVDVRHVMDDLKDLVLAELEDCKRVKLLGIVQLEPKVKPARKKRMGRNPATGEEIEIAAKPSEAVIRARVLAEAKTATPPLASLKKALSASAPKPKATPTPKTKPKARPKPASRRK